MSKISSINDLIKMQERIAKSFQAYENIVNSINYQYNFSYLTDRIHNQIQVLSNIQNSLQYSLQLKTPAIFDQLSKQQLLINSICSKYSNLTSTLEVYIPKIDTEHLFDSLSDFYNYVEEDPCDDFDISNIQPLKNDIVELKNSVTKKNTFDWKYWLNISLQIISIIITLAAMHKSDNGLQSETLKVLNDINSKLEQQIDSNCNTK